MSLAVSKRTSEALPFESPPVGDEGIAAALAAGRPALIVERPDVFGTRRAPQPLEVSGWAWSGAGIEKVLVTIDDEIEVKALHDLFRPDLRSLFGDALATSGFAVRVDPRDWTPGWHELTVVAVDGDGRAIGISGKVESVPEEPPRTTPPDEIDTPARDQDGDRERFMPGIHRAVGPTAEHAARYAWAASVVAGASVLDAGCGAGAGTASLVTHASSATGLDLSPAAVRAARRAHGDVATFREGDLLDLPFADDEFDAIACFETIEQVADVERALDELQRVLSPGGLLLISCANRGVYPPGNPLHLNELTADELHAILADRFADVAIHRQQTYLVSLLCDNEDLHRRDPDRPIDATTTKAAGAAPGTELYVLAAATDGELPQPPARLVIGSAIDDVERDRLTSAWQARCAEAESMASVARSHARFQRSALTTRLDRHAVTEATLTDRLRRAEDELSSARDSTTALLSSSSWRITAPLRRAGRGLRRLGSEPRPADAAEVLDS